jgi:RNA polymerase sigma factor (sigma-70 family)
MGPVRSAREDQARYPSDDLANAVLGPVAVEIFENLYAAYADDARRMAYALLHDRELAADAAQAAFLELLRYILAGKRWYEPAEARAAVLRNTNWAALKVLRLRRRRPELAIAAVGQTEGDDAAWGRAEARAVCEQVVARLRPAQQAALQLHFVEGLTNAQSAARLGISVSAFEARLARAVRSARRAARGIGLVPAAVLALRAGGHRALRPRPMGRRVIRSLLAASRPAVIATASLATVVALAGPLRIALAHRDAPPMRATAAAPAAVMDPTPLDTPRSSRIVDEIQLPNHAVVLLGEGSRCSCGVVFATRDAGRSWSAVRGPDHVTSADRLARSARTGFEVVVLARDGTTFSSPDLSALGA